MSGPGFPGLPAVTGSAVINDALSAPCRRSARAAKATPVRGVMVRGTTRIQAAIPSLSLLW